MKTELEHLNKIFDSRIRIGIMSALMVNENISFNALKELMDATDGNLASHLKTLEEHQYIAVSKSFVGRKTNTTYAITEIGQKDFRNHLNALEKIIQTLR